MDKDIIKIIDHRIDVIVMNKKADNKPLSSSIFMINPVLIDKSIELAVTFRMECL